MSNLLPQHQAALEALVARPEIQAIFNAFDYPDTPLYLVGGAVRNTLLGLPLEDVDFATPLLPNAVRERIQSCLGPLDLRFVHYGHTSGWVPDVEHSLTYRSRLNTISTPLRFTITTFRDDRHMIQRNGQVMFTDRLIDDAIRRDFTLNAIYLSADGRMLDPLLGYQDLLRQSITFIGNPVDRMKSDPLRAMRLFRMLALFESPHLKEATFHAVWESRTLWPQIAPAQRKLEWKKLCRSPFVYPTMLRLSQWGMLSLILGSAVHPRLWKHPNQHWSDWISTLCLGSIWSPLDLCRLATRFALTRKERDVLHNSLSSIKSCE